MTELKLHTIKPARGSRAKRKLVGRGPGTGLGKTAGRGGKGQRARSGGKSGLKQRGLKRIVLRIPKNRGFHSRILHPETVTLVQLDRWFDVGEEVTVEALKRRGRIPMQAIGAKVVQTGDVTKALKLIDLSATAGAKAAIEKAGGSVGTVSKKSSKNRKRASK